ncbi:MAG: metallophosphoesterase [Clostridiales Family XIII bacterium]|jgi:hypothetical protein|nr:metallophosphoesterase [Clostridiales Family XIII bacterium]
MTFNKIRLEQTPVAAKRLAVAALLGSMLLTSLSNGAGALVASADSPPVTLIDAHSAWSYSDTDTDLFGDAATDFRSRDFDDSAWLSGPQPIGYPAAETDNGAFGRISEVGSLVANRANPNAYITYYLRTGFSVSGIADISALNARIHFDDGYNMYLNGHLIDSMYMPADAGHGTAANYVGEAKESASQRAVDLTAYRQYLVEGDGNVISVDLHNRDQNSSDIYWGMTLNATYSEAGEPDPEPGAEADPDATPAQVNVHMGDDPATQANFTFTTIKPSPSVVTIDGTAYEGESSVGASDKYFHKVAVSGLSPDTEYSYAVGEAPNVFEGGFKTAPEYGSKDSFRFIYLADTQVSSTTNAEALGATLAEVANMDPDFVYLAGDITDTATSESQWEGMFKNSGAFPEGGQEMFGSYLIAAIQGNHDNNTSNRHINAPAQQGNIVYSFDYGPATFVMLNLEAARSDATARASQKEFLTAAVNEAKARGQWVAVGFHKSLYTGASHITDSDVIEARTYWCPVFAQLDVDFVLQGHDHVYSRGFVNEDGTKAMDAPEGASVSDPENAPLYMIGGHAGGLKWYSMKNYAVTPGDPLIPGYAFLDVDSANPAHNEDGRGSDSKQEQVIVELEVSEEKVDINCYMFKYDTASDTITTQKYLYDSLTVMKAGDPEDPEEPGEARTTASISGPATASVRGGQEIEYVVSYANLVNANAFETGVEYDAGKLEFVRAESLADGTVLSSVVTTDGGIDLITGLSQPISAESQDVAKFVFKVRADAQLGQTTVSLVKADTVNATMDDGAILASADVQAEITGGASTSITDDVPDVPGDMNDDGEFTLADLSMALGRYQSTDAADLSEYDLNGDGVVDTADFIIICLNIRTGA